MSQVLLEGEVFPDRKQDEPILKVNNLSVHFSKQRGSFWRRKSVLKAVDDVSFGINKSRAFSLVGESGSGKTTIARCILRLVRPTSGSISYNGVDITRLKGRALMDYRRDVQMIFQDPFGSLNPRQNVITTLSIPIRSLCGEKNRSRILETASRLLAEVGLSEDEVVHKFPHQLSGGQRQRVNIARALATNPKLLVADEPITMLDASQRLTILSLIMQLKLERDLTVLLITHDLASAKIFGGVTGIMYLGKLVELGPTEKVLSKPHHPYTELILSSMPRLRLSSEAVEDRTPAMEESMNVKRGCVFSPRCKYVTSICNEVEPKLGEKSEHHTAACHNPLNI